MARRRQPESSANHERWLVSYADFITLLFAFFTTLYAISVVDARKAERLVQSIQESFGESYRGQGAGDLGMFEEQGDTRLHSVLEGLNRSAAEIDEARLGTAGHRARELAQAAGFRDGLRVRQTEEGLVISLADTLFFEGGAAQIEPHAIALLEKVAELVSELPNHVRVEGHTDDRPVAQPGISSNWHVSVARAVAVVQELEKMGVARRRLSASGFADQRPLVSNGTAEGRRINRRVDIVLLRAGASANDL